MSEQPPALDAILASIRARVMEPDTGPEPEWQPARVTAPPSPPPVLLSDVMIPASSAGMTLDELMRSMLSPQIKAWLDAIRAFTSSDMCAPVNGSQCILDVPNVYGADCVTMKRVVDTTKI